jgi:imidazolonepropionase-like amidohydrolase
MKFTHTLTAAIFAGSFSALAITNAATSPDPLAPRPNGMQPADPSLHLITDATVHTEPGTVIEHADVLIDNGQIISIGSDLDAGSATVWNIEGAHIYAGFIEPFIEVDAPMPPENSVGMHWSSKVIPQRNALDIGLPADAAQSLRKMGFTTAMIAPDGGIFRGQSAIVSTAQAFTDASMGSTPTYQSNAGLVMGFDRSSWPDNDYPNSHMGVIALMRQSFSDAEHRASSKHSDISCLDSINPKNDTLFYDISHELEALLANNIAIEFDHKDLVIIDNGTAHRRLDAFKDMGYPVIVPLRFPEAPEVFTVGGADTVDLATLQHWERAPANARWLANSGLTVALTTSKGNSHDKFWNNLHTAIKKGLAPDDALAMITTNPAEIIGLHHQGTIAKNQVANLVVASGDLFDPDAKAKIIDTWVDGRRHHISDPKDARFDGTWTATMVGTNFSVEMNIEGTSLSLTDSAGDEPVVTKATKVNVDGNSISFLTDYEGDDTGAYINTATLAADGSIRGTTLNPKPMSYTPQPASFEWVAVKSTPQLSIKDFNGTWNATLADKFNLDFKVSKETVTIIEQVEDADNITQEATNIRVENNLLAFEFEHEPFGMSGTFTIGLNPPSEDPKDTSITGIGTLPDGKAFTIAASKEIKDSDSESDLLPDLPSSPFGPFTYDSEPEQNTVLLTNATVWTQSDDGVLENAWVLINDGKVSRVGSGPAPRVSADQHIDAQGMHITPGLIDAHSHTGLFRFGVNESGQAVTSEVRISDSLDPGHPGFYRELAGGLTTANLLHGSANPIGGQSKTIKLRWNADKPSDMFFDGSMPGIKFALGENVKQSNWGDRNTTRYPQTRMGVETIFRDRFTKAGEYADRGMKTESGFQDLELETLAQILAGERLVHCHSYRQDEILMLCRIAEEFGFKIGTFQHGLETYKVAEAVKEHAIGTSIFSDWWAYKVEVQDAIPFAGPINHEVGLLTSFNSDSDDVARRMHVEAGKALKYAKLSGIEMSEQDALNFVTLNPAIQLGIDDRVGSLEKGKDADLVVWTGHPLSSLSRPEMTFVDGRLYFSRDLDQELRIKNDAERQRLIQLIHSGGKSDANGDKDGDKPSGPDRQGRRGRGPDDHTTDGSHTHFNIQQGECGCDQLLPAWNTDY